MSPPLRSELHFAVSDRAGNVSAVLLRPPNARWVLVLAHGAGAGMHHPFMSAVSEELSERSIATFRYQFPYMEQGGGRPDPPVVLVKTVEAAVKAGAEVAPDLPLIAGGKSLGGRMTSTAVSQGLLPMVDGIVFFGFPLHPAGQPSIERARHLQLVKVPMLFLQGTRDKLAELELLRPVCSNLSDRAQLHIIEGADHSFVVPKRLGRTDRDVLRELGGTVAAWAGNLGTAAVPIGIL